ncbi:hypothetical protein GCM10009609_02760 [Pseudonocardia aurantiaca]
MAEPAAEPLVVGERGVHHLQREDPALAVGREVHLTHPARPEPAEKAVRPDRAWVVPLQRLHASPRLLRDDPSARTVTPLHPSR